MARVENSAQEQIRALEQEKHELKVNLLFARGILY